MKLFSHAAIHAKGLLVMVNYVSNAYIFENFWMKRLLYPITTKKLLSYVIEIGEVTS